MDFGKFLVGAIGYGFTLVLLIGVLAAFRDFGKAKRGVRGVDTPEENMQMVVCGIVAAFVVAVLTRVILGVL